MSKVLPSDLLKRGWCQGASARTAKSRHYPKGRPCHANAPMAAQWCMWGAVVGSDIGAYNETLVEKAAWRITGGPLNEYNDAPGRTQEEVIQVMVEAEKMAIDEFNKGVFDAHDS